VRIVGGELRGRALASPGSHHTRPTSDRTREALFNILAHGYGERLAGARVLDLFAGTGALGLEALSRGAASATFIESDAQALASIRRNAEKLGASTRVQIVAGSALALPRRDPFDVVFADPPYAAGSGTAVVRSIVGAGWLAPGGWLCVETSRGDAIEGEALAVETVRDIGRARITLLRCP